MFKESNINGVFTTLGASSHASEQRQREDFYATDPQAIEMLLKLETFNNVWEPACGMGHISEVLKKHGIHGKSTDLINRGYGTIQDFLCIEVQSWDGDIITNPPFRAASEFVEQSLRIVKPGAKVAMFLRIQFLEGKYRKQLFRNNPPKTIYISSSRINCAKNGDFEKYKVNSAICFCWFVWQKGFKGDSTIKWFN